MLVLGPAAPPASRARRRRCGQPYLKQQSRRAAGKKQRCRRDASRSVCLRCCPVCDQSAMVRVTLWSLSWAPARHAGGL